MKLPWDKNYMRIVFHVVVALVATYILVLLVDSAAFILTNVGGILDSISMFFGRLLSIFSVVVIAFVIAYLLDPAVDFFQRQHERITTKHLYPFLQKQFNKLPLYRKLRGESRPKKKRKYPRRTAGALIVYLVIALILTAVVWFLVVRIGGGRQDMGEVIISGANKAYIQITEFYASLRITLEEWGVADYMSDVVSDIVAGLAGIVKKIPDSIGTIAANAGSVLAGTLISIVVAFYFMRDKAYILARTKTVAETFLPRRFARRTGDLLREINTVFAGYIRGRLTDSMIMSVLLSIGLSTVGVPFAVPIGIFSGMLNIIPYFGGIAAFVISVFVALLAGDPSRAFWAAVVVLGLQQVDSILIEPRVVGQKVELNPALVMISLAVGGNLFGIWGMVFAVPVCALLKIFISRFVNRRAREQEIEGLTDHDE